jgi:hypothetical protein
MPIEIKCPACSQSFHGDSELDSTILLAKHVRDALDSSHAEHKAAILAKLEALLEQAAARSTDDKTLYQAMTGIDEQLKEIRAQIVSAVSNAIERIQNLLTARQNIAGVRELKAGRSMLRELHECMAILNREL